MFIAITFIVAFVLALGCAAHDDGILAGIFGTIALVAFSALAFMGITSQYTADMDTRADTCAVMWEGATTHEQVIDRITDVCNIDDTRAERILAESIEDARYQVAINAINAR